MGAEASKRGKRCRRKGVVFEREMVNTFKNSLPGWHIRRGLQCRGGVEAPDVEAVFDGVVLHIECKTGKAPNVRQAAAQAVRDANPHAIPIAVCHWDNAETIAAMPLDALVQLLRLVAEVKP